MKDENSEVIYVGKAISLKNRVSQYFHSSKNQPPKVKAMVKNIRSFEYIITDSELEALILEANLIKKHKPKYNILLRDDKQYPFISINLKKKFPTIRKTRQMLKDGAKYFGPFTNVTALNDTIETIGELYPIRTCNLNLDYGKRLTRPCLNYFIGKCKGPCFQDIDEEEYMDMIHEIIMFLSGKNDKLISAIQKKMETASDNLEFEKAAMYRDRIESLKLIREKQKIVYNMEDNQDVIGMARGLNESCIQIFFIRKGKIVGREFYMVDNTEGLDKSEILSSFMKQYYLTATNIPLEVLIEEEIEDSELIQEWLSEKRGSKVKVKVPKKGDKNNLMEMVKMNAFEELKKNETKIREKKPINIKNIEKLKLHLGLEKLPRRIEAYDISNTQGVHSVGSMVVFIDGVQSKKDYRKFKIKYVEGPDDYSSLEEVLERRVRRGLEEIRRIEKKDIKLESFSIFPDLIIMDGGKGQVNIALKVIKKFNLDIPVCGLVKDDFHRTRGIIYNNKEIEIEERSLLFKFLTRVQDEAHNYAISYHRELLNKNMIKSILDTIPLIGEQRKKNLLRKFGSVENIKKASIEDLRKTPSMNIKAAEEVYNFFNK